MNKSTVPLWHAKRTEETRRVEEVLRQAGFQQVDAYRYNSASIRVRVIDPRFAGKNVDERDAMVDVYLRTLPERTQADILNLMIFTPEELATQNGCSRTQIANLEFEEPSPSEL